MFGMKKWAAGLAAAVAVVGLGFVLAVGPGQRVEGQPPAPSGQARPADDLKAQREKLDQDIAAAKERVKQLEAQKAQLQQLALLREFDKRLVEQMKAEVEPHIGVWVRPPQVGPPPVFSEQNLLELSFGKVGGPAPGFGWRSEFAINEFTGKDKPVVRPTSMTCGAYRST